MWFFRLNADQKSEMIKELAFTKITPEIEFKNELDEKLKYQPFKYRKEESKYLLKASKYSNIFEELELSNDWCISDNCKWGIPIPYFVYKKKGRIILI